MGQIKRYPIHQSPLFKLASKRKLGDLLRVDQKQLLALSQGGSYHVFNRGGREIQTPVRNLRAVHDRLQQLFSRIEAPDYLYSGVVGRSSIANAQAHIDNSYVVKTDISSFYANSVAQFVWNMFRYDFRCQPDVASILTDICCYQGVVPTGSPVSQNIAFWSHVHMFDDIKNLACQYGAVFTLYVDDMTFSCPVAIDLSIIPRMQRIIHQYGLEIKPKKTKKYGCNDYKIVTGVVITPGHELKIPNKHKIKAIDFLRSKDKMSSFVGLVSYMRSIEPGLFKSSLAQVCKKSVKLELR